MKSPPAGSVALTLVVGMSALVILAGVGTTFARKDANVVQLADGKVRGVTIGDVLVFKGIPFAQPPVGDLRWRAPQPVQPWKGVRDATTFSSDPAQPAQIALTRSSISEDCLYLNLWRPASIAKNTRLPVMVWIWGGGLVKGGASIYPGENLARQGIMVVTFNYRVGRLGFFAHPALAAESPKDPRGNYGYMDQIAALKWVQLNIAAFGGDPTNVTLAGESAGGGSVLVMLTSPLARGLFQRAILESPGIPTPRAVAGPMRSLPSAESIAIEYAGAHGITGDGPTVLAGLRALSTDQLTEGVDQYALAIFGGPEILGLSHSIIDGRLVVEAPEVALRAGRMAKVPVIVGANDHDMAVSPAETKDALFSMFGARSSQARELYDPSGDESLTDLRQAVCSDLEVSEPTSNLAECVAKGGQPAYFYRFGYVPEAWRATMPGAVHAGELIFVFDSVPVLLKDKATAADFAMARTMSGYWVDFVKTGNPNGGGRPAWPSYEPTERDVLNITNTRVSFGRDPLRERLDLWREVWESCP